jgi:hypothetical protein
MNTGDLEPKWIVDIAAEAGTDFTTVQSWRFDAYRETTNGKVEAFSDTDPIVIDGAAVYQVTLAHAWVTGETDTPGVLHAVPVAVWPGGREQSFPGASIEIVPDPS